MESVIINGKNKEDLNLVIKLAKKLGLTAHSMTKTKMEEMALAEEIKKGMKTPKVSREDVMKALDK